MPTKAIYLVALASLLTAGAAEACGALDGRPGESPVETRRPVRGDDVRLTSGFGMRRHPLLQERRLHAGVDWAAPMGTPVIAAGRGRVLLATAMGVYGNSILIDHGAGWQTFYAQLASFDVREGDCVASGALIGKVGSTGLSSGPHLHFEVQRDGQPVDPMSVRERNAPSETEDKQ